MNIRLVSLFLFIGLILNTSCEEDPLLCTDENSLACFIQENQDRSLSKNLIACAAGGEKSLLDNPDLPVSVYFYPIPTASEYRYFETKDLSADPEDFGAFSEVLLEDRPVFNGYLRRFLRTTTTEDTWGRVVYFTPDSIHVSNAIRLKYGTKPTEFAPEKLSIDLNSPTEPVFSWEDGLVNENAIYFQVIATETGDLVSGTYTYDKQFRFYDLNNVVLNIRDVSPTPNLIPGNTYSFTLMGVSLDNWVNLIIEQEFVAE